ncbi:MAG: glycosyltransferase [Saprospiraceae bacterium]|nr:glycosyltransferase [Saprospiraceae bacterium]
MRDKYQSYLVAAGWILIGALALTCFRQLSAIERGLLVIGLVGAWRYSLQIVHVVRNGLYTYRDYPRLLRAVARNGTVHFDRLVIVVADYRIPQQVRTQVWRSIERATCALRPDLRVDIIYASDAQAIPHTNETTHTAKGPPLALHQLTQYHGKRRALADALDYARRLGVEQDRTVVALMDGDTSVDPDTLARVLAVFDARPHLGALTTNERVDVKTDNPWIRNWYRLKFRKRNHYMRSHALSRRVLTLTGRFSAYHGDLAFTDDFVARLRRDVVHHWLHGSFDFLMGDDKSTCFTVLKAGRDMLYIHDAYVTTHEETGSAFLPATVGRMVRWYGNMLRNAPRTIALGRHRMPAFIWYCHVDQLIAYWTTLIGPLVGLTLLFKFGPAPFLGYLGFVIVTRTLQLLILVWQGHRMTAGDLLLTVYDQWFGSLLKIYCTFYPHLQSFALRHGHRGGRSSVWKEEVSYSLVTLSVAAEAAIIVLMLQ